MKEYNIEYFKNLAKQKGGECLSDNYINCRSKLEFRCQDNHTWHAQPRHIANANTWCPKCHQENARKYPVKDDFFAEDNEQSFYWAGFWAADGWKSKTTKDSAYTVGITLAEKDKHHLLKIKKELQLEKEW